MTKSNDDKSDLPSGQASKQQSDIATHLLLLLRYICFLFMIVTAVKSLYK